MRVLVEGTLMVVRSMSSLKMVAGRRDACDQLSGPVVRYCNGDIEIMLDGLQTFMMCQEWASV